MTSYITGLTDMEEQSTAYLRQKRKKLIQRLTSTVPAVIRGSLIERYKRCGKRGCKCAEGSGHGPKYYLSVSHPGRRPEMDYVPRDYIKEVEQYLSNFKKVRQILEEISNINREILRRRQRF